MKKRQFLASSMTMVLGTSALPVLVSQAADNRAVEEQVILTLAGAIDRTNRGKSDAMLDQLMHKNNIHFERAFDFTMSSLLKLSAVTISPTMEYDEKPHHLTGPRLLDVLNFAGIKKNRPTKIIFHAVDGYSPECSFNLVKKYDFIVATHMDGKLLSIGGFGPLFAIYDADRILEIMQKPLSQRFPICPWGLYCIEIV